MTIDELIQSVIGACFEVSNELGAGFVESVYEKALLVALREKGFNADNQSKMQVVFRGVVVGNFCADIVVQNKLVIELKAVKMLLPEHIAQLLNYLRTSRKEAGLLVNFGRSRIEYRRFDNRFLKPDV